MLSFGVTILPDPPYTRLIELMKLAEQQGFEYGWTYDSHVLWLESVPLMALLAKETTRMKLGHMVTNPATRDPTVLASAYATLHDISDGRMIMGIGRGDSAVRYIGRKPMKVADFEQALRMVKPFMNGEEVTWNDKQLQLHWVRPELLEIEMHVAGYGPKFSPSLVASATASSSSWPTLTSSSGSWTRPGRRPRRRAGIRWH